MILHSIHRATTRLALLSALLYGALGAFATGAAHAADSSAPQAHMALILPLTSPAFGRAADAVRQGFLAAAKVAAQSAPPIRIYPVNEDTAHVLTVYEQAVESGARLVIGPLTRNGVTALAQSNLVTVPTLVLNSPEPRSPHPTRMYLFGLNIELEARQVARLAFDDGRRKAFLINDDTALGRRMRQAFVEEFARLGGQIIVEYGYSSDPPTLSKLRQAANLGVADMFFLALDAERAGTVRPYLGSLGVYATSQVNAGVKPLAARELNQVRFVDMPWLLQADHPAVMVYPRAQVEGSELERFYALGIDAFRIGLELLRRSEDVMLDGVTGRIRLTPDQQFTRDLPAAQFSDGKAVVVSDTR